MISSTLVLEVRNDVVGVAIAVAVVDTIVGSVVVVVFVVDAVVVVVVVVVIVMGVGVSVEVGDGDGNDGNDNNNGNDGKADDVSACALVEGYSVVENNTPLWYWKSVMYNIYFSSGSSNCFIKQEIMFSSLLN